MKPVKQKEHLVGYEVCKERAPAHSAPERFVELRDELRDLLNQSCWDVKNEKELWREIDIKCIRMASVCRTLMGI